MEMSNMAQKGNIYPHILERAISEKLEKQEFTL